MQACLPRSRALWRGRRGSAATAACPNPLTHTIRWAAQRLAHADQVAAAVEHEAATVHFGPLGVVAAVAVNHVHPGCRGEARGGGRAGASCAHWGGCSCAEEVERPHTKLVVPLASPHARAVQYRPAPKAPRKPHHRRSARARTGAAPWTRQNPSCCPSALRARRWGGGQGRRRMIWTNWWQQLLHALPRPQLALKRATLPPAHPATPTRHQRDVPRLLVPRHQLRQVRHAGWRQVSKCHAWPPLPRRPRVEHAGRAVPYCPHQQAAGLCTRAGRQRHHRRGLRFCQVPPRPRRLQACKRAKQRPWGQARRSGVRRLRQCSAGGGEHRDARAVGRVGAGFGTAAGSRTCPLQHS